MYRLIGDDCAATIEFGGAQSAAGPTYTTAVNVKPFATDFDAEDKLETVGFKAFGDSRKKMRGHTGETSVNFTFYVDGAVGPIGKGMIGQYIRAKITPLASLSGSLETYTGLLTGRKITGGAGQEQKETFTIECDAE